MTLARVVLGFALGLSACARIDGELRPPQPRPGQGVRAGAARVDITPPPGFPMGGHSIEGRVALGTWTRLHARTIYIEDDAGTPLVVSITDLWGMPSGLNDRVAELVAEHDDMRHVGREHIVVAATHTHHGPANLASSRVFSRFVGPKPGFDPALFEFVAMRIAASVVEAARDARPAEVAAVEVTAPGLARNRSLPPFLENPEAEAMLAAGDSGDRCHTEPLPDAGKAGGNPCDAVDSTIHVLHFTNADDPRSLIAVLGVFAVHPTAMPNRNLLYSGDLVSVAAARAEHALRDAGQPVVAIFNGAEGDVSPNWTEQGRAETVRLGNRLADEILSVREARPRMDEVTLQTAFEMVDVAGVSFVDGQGVARTTAARGLPGTATVGGAEDGRTRWHGRGFTEGRVARRERLAGHGPKRPPVPAALLEMSLPAAHVPQRVPIGLHRVGPLVLTTLPGEFTTTMGRRIRQGVADAAGVPLRDVIALGLASGHLEYFTTAQEYALQHYEGSSSFFGPHAGALVQTRSAELATTGALEVPKRYEHRPGRKRRFRPGGRAPNARQWATLADVLSAPSLPTLPAFRFDDAAAPWPPESADLAVIPTVWLLQQGDDGVWRRGPSDEGVEVVTLAQGRRRGRVQWRAIWLEPPQPPRGRARFVVRGVAGDWSCSVGFDPSLETGLVDESPCDGAVQSLVE